VRNGARLATVALALAVVIGVAPSAGAQPGAPQAAAPIAGPTPPLAPGAGGDFGPLERSLRDLLARGGVPGAAIAVLRDGAVAWVRPLGVSDAGSGSLVTADTVFEATGLGAPVFAYAVMRLAERGEFDLDRPLSVYLPLNDLWNDPRSRKVTARRVLCHTAGFPNVRHGSQLTIDFDPGDKFSFSGEGYLYLQRAVEAVIGMGIDDLVRREVFQPLGMISSGYVWRDAWEGNAAVGHDYLQRPARKVRPARADVASTLHTTVGDYARFLAEMLRPTLVKPATVDQMLRPQIEVEKEIAWGLGWGLERTSGRTYFWHWGNNVAFQGLAVGCRETGEGLVFLTNGENGLSIAEAAVGQVIGGSHPVFAWLDVDRYDSPARTIRERLVRAGVAGEDRGVDRALGELERTYPRGAFTEKLLNRIGYELLGQKHVAGAIAVFEHNVKLYPKSWNAYDSLAEAYAADGNVRFAFQYYEKSLKLNPDNENAKAALRELREAEKR
jgi:CubicO group peptidase (beta-lactamase class C family)